MNSSFKKIGSIIAYLIMAGISCWATQKSLHLLLPTGWPSILVWGMTIAFFVVASFGTKLIVDSFMSADFVENRYPKLFGGILLVVCFWLIMSMPTNTHTFFYNDQIGNVVTKDIETTNKYLQQIIDKGTGTTRTLDATGKEIFDKVEELRRKIVTEFNGDGPTRKRGNGKQIGRYLEEINKILNSNIQQDPRYNSSDSEILNKYHAEINVALNSALKPHTITASTVSKARTEKNRLTAMNDSIQIALAVGNISEEEIKQVEKLLADGYNTIQSNNQFVEFDSTTDDEEVYTRENGVTRTKRMSSVIEVFFVDFMQGKYPSSFWYYVILSILVDIAAFIFFDIAFKEESDFI